MKKARPEYYHPKKVTAFFSSCLMMMICFLPSFAEAQDKPERPRIGLALSGGGAHGIAHVGVLKVMEEAGLRPDYITGVSMGSIVGGMYSLGYSADSIAKILNSLNMDLIINNRIPENKIIFEEKRHFYNSIMSLPIKSTKVILPTGIMNGQQVENMLNYYAWPAADISDFSKLPIPFSCMAVDIVTVTKQELRHGYLPDAMRASMAIPTVFTPVQTDSSLLVDGGLLRNIAVSEVKAMGADIVIGSYTGFQQKNEEELQTATGIIKQIGFMQSYWDFSNEKEKIDILIEPHVKDLPSMEFDNPDTTIERGYKAALVYKEEFKRLADSLNSIAPQKPLENILDRQFHAFDRIEVTGNKITDAAQVTGVLDIEPGQKVDKEKLREGIELLYGKAWFEKIRYRVVPRNDSLILVIDCIEKPQTMLYGSVHYDDALKAGLIIGFSSRNLLTRRSVINADAYIADYFRYNVIGTQFIGRNQKFGLSISLAGDNSLYPSIEMRGIRGAVTSTNFYSMLNINKRIGLNNMMNLSAGIENLFLSPEFPTECGITRFKYNYISGSFDYQANTLNTKHFPDKGIVYLLSGTTSKLYSGKISSDSLNAECALDNPHEFSFDRFYTLRGSFSHYFSPGRKVSCNIKGEALYITATDSITARNNFFLLGGIQSSGRRSVPAAGFHPYQIPVKELAGVGFETDIEVFRDVHLTFSVNAFAIREAGMSSGYSLLAGYSAGAGYMSIIGPIKAGIMQGFYTEESGFHEFKGYISVGFNF
ncbi:MAG: patatin-like phospholipase family protein [Bacteroidales bacterium]|jgi:NTE family protein|nr:patatin-like phospholipase family protein [Bacteroidales bacterium]